MFRSSHKHPSLLLEIPRIQILITERQKKQTPFKVNFNKTSKLSTKTSQFAFSYTHSFTYVFCYKKLYMRKKNCENKCAAIRIEGILSFSKIPSVYLPFSKKPLGSGG